MTDQQILDIARDMRPGQLKARKGWEIHRLMGMEALAVGPNGQTKRLRLAKRSRSIPIRVTPEEANIMAVAAARRNQSRSVFIRNAALAAARRIVG